MPTDYLKSGMERLRAQAFPRTATAIQGAGQNIREAYQQGGIPAAAGATVRNTMVPAMGLAHDIYSGARQVTDPVGEAAGTFARTAATGNATPIRGAQVPSASTAPAPRAAPAPRQDRAPSELERNNARIMNPDYDVFGGGAGSGGTPAQPGQMRTGRVPGASEIMRTVSDGGQVSYSGQGSAPAGATPGANDMMARLERLRQLGAENTALRDRINFNQGGGGSFRKTTNEEIARDLLTGKSQSGRQAGLQMMQAQQQGQQQAREMSLREMLANPQIAAQQLATEQTGRINALQRRLEASKDPAEREQLTDLLRRLTGKEAPMDFSLARIQIGQDSMGEPVIGQIPFNQRTGQYVMPPGQGKTLPPDVTPEDAMSQARAAISAGAPRDAVNKRLQEMGLEPI